MVANCKLLRALQKKRYLLCFGCYIKILGGIYLKKIFLILSYLTFFTLSTSLVQAKEVTKQLETQEILYNLEEGGIQLFESMTSEGNQIIIKVEEIPVFSKGVTNGAYKISASTPGHWEASYQILVNNNKITNAYSPSIKAYTGSFISAELKLDNSAQATYYMKKKTYLITTSINLRANLLPDKISITY